MEFGEGGEKAEFVDLSLDHIQSVKDASAIEQTVYDTMVAKGAERYTDDISDRVVGLEREIWAVKSSLQRLDGEEQEESGLIVQDPLQQALMEERLKSLEGEYKNLKSLSNQSSFMPNGIAAAGISSRDLQSQQEPQGQRQGKRPRGQPSLVEANLFDEARPKRGGKGGSLIETERDRLIRLGLLTPFDNLGGFERRVEGDSHIKEASIADVGRRVRDIQRNRRTAKLMDAADLPKPLRNVKKVNESFWRAGAKASLDKQKQNLVAIKRNNALNDLRKNSKVDQEDENPLNVAQDHQDTQDDMNEDAYRVRQAAARVNRTDSGMEREGEEEDIVFQGGYRIPFNIYSKLFDYQRTAIKWLWELHTQRAGGIMGDEMGLGKTIQITSFLAGLHHSGLFKPSLIVCPATMLRQWLRELREWYPHFRVAILHDSARTKGGSYSRSSVVKTIAGSSSGILITTYDQMRLCKKDLLSVRWGYCVLDEGHKIRNPDAEVTLAAKQIPTVHRIILSGSPIQNRLVELWSLFDFVFPGKLGTLPVFQAQFAIPIQQGGYANASSLQVATAYKCAVVLRDMISPYLLRRKKADVAKALPKKTERVLFCSLSNAQRDMYLSYLASKELSEILNGDRGALLGIDILRKICNHPDLLDKNKWDSSTDYGDAARSGKMLVLDKILKHWIDSGQKALVFTQTQQMLDILEKMIISRGWTYHRMDGSTPVGMRSKLIDDFNSNPNVSLFLLTTRVGGLGINLTGASKCVIFDPDWNPSTDVQARERAWRIGQTKEVTVYRLIVSGTIEEKVYHRQVYKQFMTDKVLKDPRQKRFFKAKDLSDLFTLGDEYAEGTETAAIFSSLGPFAAVNNTEDLEALEKVTTDPRDTAFQRNLDHDSVDAPKEQMKSEQQEGDAHILKELFDHAGIQSALDHDKIETAHNPSNNIAQKEAKKVAEKAAKALRKSRESLRSTPVTVPTWTGRSGLAGAPALRRQLDISLNTTKSSASILAKIRSRNAEASSLDVLHPDVSAGKTLADRLITFLRARGGSATSATLASNFQTDTSGAISPELFKCVLREVATLMRSQGGRMWKLKPDFMD